MCVQIKINTQVKYICKDNIDVLASRVGAICEKFGIEGTRKFFPAQFLKWNNFLGNLFKFLFDQDFGHRFFLQF